MAARLIVLGRQGAGKGTQCARLASRLGISHLSTGDMFRREIAAGSDLGRKLDRYVQAGELVPDELVLDVVARDLGSTERRAGGYLLDGFPRTVAQGQALFEVLGGGAVDLAVEIDVPRDVVLQRIASRRICDRCHAVTSEAEAAGQACCRTCGGALTRRADDTPEAVTRRLDIYEEEAGPLLVWLDNQGLLETVEGVGATDEVHRRILSLVARRIPLVRMEAG